MTDRTFVDTNVWVYAVDDADPTKQAQARRVLDPAAGLEIAISAQVLSEFYVVTTRKLAKPLSAEAAQAFVQELARLPVVDVDAQLVMTAITAGREWRLSLWDALIVRAAEVAGCRRLLSEDLADRAIYGDVQVENPFAS